MAEKDFIGFKFDNIHSNSLGIIRVSDGDRFEEQLHPEIKDITAEVPGKDGEYYFGSTYGNKEIEIKIAYDSLTEAQFRDLRRIFGGRGIHELIFDERPYKKYLVKISSPIELNYICFDEPEYIEDTTKIGLSGNYPLKATGKTQRIYKGEGTISLITYTPFAKSVYEILPNPDDPLCPANMNEWIDSSRILTEDEFGEHYINQYTRNPLDHDDQYCFPVYNAGDVSVGCRIYCPFDYDYTEDPLVIEYKPGGSSHEPYKGLIIEGIERAGEELGGDVGFMINTETGLIQGVFSISVDQETESIVNITMSPNLYGKYLTAGSFFKIEPSGSKDESSTWDARVTITGGNSDMKIFYDYLYF